MSVDGAWDDERDAPARARARDVSRTPGLDRAPSADIPSPHAHADQAPEAGGVPGVDRAGDLRAENVRLGRALGELSTENAELYKRVGQLEAELKTEKARHAAWSREMDRREEARAARDGAMAGRLKQLERALAERHDTADPGTLSGRLEKKESSAPEQIRQERRGGRFSNETIAVGVAVSAEVFTVAGDVLGAAPAEAGGLIAGAFGLIAAVIAWSRSRGKERHVHRPEDRGANP